MNIDPDDLQAACYSISVLYYSDVKLLMLMFFFEDTLFIEESLIAPCMTFIYTYYSLGMFFFFCFCDVQSWR